MRFRARDYAHFLAMYARNARRQARWQRRFEAAIRDGSLAVSTPAVVQLIPTEACNLRCAMCNQWGDNGYFRAGVRPVDHMPREALLALLDSTSPADAYISVHGGEPLAYKHADAMFERLAARGFDVMVSTNGTLIDRHVEALAAVDNLSLLLSIDGDEATHDRIRGRGRFRQAEAGLRQLCERRRQLGKPLPLVICSFVVCEHNGEAIVDMPAVARRLGAFVLNYNMRWFLDEDVGRAYERQLREVMGVESSGAWRGWLSEYPDHDYRPTARALAAAMRWRPRHLLPPYRVTTPSQLRGQGDYERYFTDYLEVFGNDSCFMPFYWARIHASGELIFCPGHPDVIAGNVFADGLVATFNAPRAIAFRRHLLEHRLPICNRCCGLYMTNVARRREQASRRRLGLPRQVTFSLG